MKKIRNKILMSIILCVFIFSFIIGTISILESSKLIHYDAGTKIQGIAQINSDQLNNLIISSETITNGLKATILATINTNKTILNSTESENILRDISKNIIKKNKEISGIYIEFNSDILNANNKVIYEDGKNNKVKPYDLVDENKRNNITNRYYNAVQQNKGVWNVPSVEYLDNGLKRNIISYTEPIFKDKELIGIVGVDIDIDVFTNIINKIKISNTGYAFLLNEKYDYIVHKNLKKHDNLKTTNNGEYRYIANQISKHNTGITSCFFDGEKRLLGYSHLSNGWIIVTSIAQKEIFERLTRLIFFILTITIIGILISARVGLYVSKKISKPVILASEFAQELANGNLDGKLDIISDDETKGLSIALNKAAINISTLINKLRETKKELIKQVEDLKKSEEMVSCLAYNNYVTKLPNRNFLMKELPNILHNLDNNNSLGALVYLDIDNFRIINDTLGHTTGDKFLKQISNDFKKLLRNNDILCHIGEDAFVFFLSDIDNILSDINNTYDIEIFCNKILKLFEKPIHMENNKKFYITSSIGIALYPHHGKDIETLLRNADTALNKAKNNGKNKFEIYSDDMNLTLLRKIDLENKLRQAIENNELSVFYQPKIDTKTGEMISMESLVRWISPTLGFISPADFIPLAEETGLIIPIGEYVLKESCRQNKEWQEKGLKPLKVAVNLSAKQLQQQNLVDVIQNTLSDTNLDANWLELEITESVLMNNFNSSINVLNKIKEIGINLYLDDFGTGYSSLNYLRKLPIHSIKIDKSFVDGLTINQKDSFIASSLINLAHGINLSVVAEGVESIEQFNLLKNYGCDQIQGYYFSKPLDPKAFEKFLENETSKI